MKTQNELVKELFEFLDATEESDSGRVFHPIAISCCRAMKLEPLGVCIKALRESIVWSEK
jgi:hypothetical protein